MAGYRISNTSGIALSTDNEGISIPTTNNVAGLRASGVPTGSLIFSTTDNQLYSFNGTSWVRASTSGSSGTAGTSGSSGTAGTSGSSGTAGTSGSSGTSGLQGPAGPQGAQGPQGFTGPQGAQGPQGIQGPQGVQGPSGSSGTAGTSGSSGTAGTSGSSGTGGTSGTSGSSGTAGTSGSAGTAGTSGTPGTSGTSGGQGGLGPQGPQGPIGPGGPQGNTGPQGPQGPQGNAGSSGTSGTTGTSGTSGGQGPQGNQGPQGAQGPQGNTGPQGPQGPQGPGGGQGPGGTSGTSGTSGITGPQGPQGPIGPNAGITSYTNPADNRVITSVNSSTINAEANLTFDGSTLVVSGNEQVTGGIYDSGVVRIMHPGGAAYTTTTSSITGAFRITLPANSGSTAPMLQFTINIYRYSTGLSTQIRVGGHISGNLWYNVFAYGMTDSAGNYNVRFGRNGSDMCVWVGETSSTWEYPQVSVTDFQNGYSTITSFWASGWSITDVSSFNTVQITRAVALSLNTNNYNSYAPTLTGTGASGSWGINVTGTSGYSSTSGSAASASTASVAYDLQASDATTVRFNIVNNNDYSTMTFFSRAWSAVQGPNGLAYTFNTHNNAGGGGYGALQIYYGESGYVFAPTSFRAPIFYDSANTTYYLDPAATGTSLNIAGKITTAVSNGTIISHASMTDAFGYNTSYGTYIGSVVGGTYYIYGNGTFWDNGTIRTFLHSGNFNSYSPTLTGTGASGTWSITATGNVASRGTSWNDGTVIGNTVGMLAWKNYGNGHVIFDASASTSPSGSSVNNTNSAIAWTGTYPTLMGWNGSQTYGVRVDSARVSDNTTGNAATAGGFTPSQSTIANGIVVRDASGYIFGNYINLTDDGNPGGGTSITSFITKQGDNYYRSVSPTNAMASIRGVASGTWSINVTGSAGSASTAGSASLVNGTSGGAIQSWDIRTIAPGSMSAYRLGFGFTSWANNNSAPYADYLHLRSYSDSSGGSDNLVMFLKSGIGMRIWQQSFGSGTGYSSYVDVWHSGNFTPGNYLALSGGTLTGPLTIGTTVNSVIWNDGTGTYMENTGNSAATRVIRLQAHNGSFSYTQLFVNGGGGYVEVNNQMRAPIYYDSQDTSYYLDPNSVGTSAVLAGTVRLQTGAFGTNSVSSSSQATLSRTFAPQGASNGFNGGGITAAIKIRLPFRANDCMWSMKVRIYNYTNDAVSEYTIGNYSYAAGAYHRAAYFMGGAAAPPRTVRFGNDGTYDCVWIGETTTSWSYPQVSVMDFQGGYVRSSVQETANNWNVTFVTSFDTVADTITPSIRFSNVTANNVSANDISAGGSLTVNSNTTSGTPAGVVNLGTTSDPSSISNSSIVGLTWGLRGDSQAYYMIRSNNMTYGGYTYNRLDLSWHTGIVIGAATLYGGIRFWNNSTNIGSLIASIGDGDNNMRSTADIIAYASDKRLKENIAKIPNALDKVLKINGVLFDWKDKTKELGFYPSQKHDVGVIAQEIQDILPEVVTLAPFDYELGKSKSGENFLTVKYEKIVPLLIEAIKELSAQNKKLEEKNREFETILNSLINRQK